MSILFRYPARLLAIGFLVMVALPFWLVTEADLQMGELEIVNLGLLDFFVKKLTL